MRITDLILSLKAAREDHGELEVTFTGEGFNIPVVKVKVEQVLRNKGTYGKPNYVLTDNKIVVLSEE